jgi:pimeloyl-ACP methyl ester carboxylesterase
MATIRVATKPAPAAVVLPGPVSFVGPAHAPEVTGGKQIPRSQEPGMSVATIEKTRAPGPLFVHRAGSGETLVLLHGLGESHIGWRPVMDQLAAEFDVVAVDLPGFGLSPALPGSVAPTADNLAAAVNESLDRLGIDRYHVAGYSLGARTAIHLAGGDRVRSVIAIAPDGLGTPVERLQGYLALNVGRLAALTLAPLAEWLSTTPLGRSVFFSGNRSLPWQLTAADARQLLVDYADAPAYDAANWSAMFDMPTHLHTITAPTLLLQGTADPLMGQQIARYLAMVPGAELRWLTGLNHVPISDSPDVVAGHMMAFLRQHASAGQEPVPS